MEKHKVLDQGDVENPLFWAWVAGGTNEAIERRQWFCMNSLTHDGKLFQCSKQMGHEGSHAGYTEDLLNDGEEWFIEWEPQAGTPRQRRT